MRQSLALTTILFSSLGVCATNIKEQTFEYKDGSTVLEGFLAYPEAAAKAPGVIVVHEWMGLNDYAKKRARQLAELGYVALAADVYGKGIRANNPADAGKLAGEYKNDPKKLRSRMNAALKALKSVKQVDTKKIAAMGYCFGGTSVLELARSGADVKGVISFHGGLSTKEPATKKGQIKSKVLVLHGADDPHVPPADVATFEDEMRTAGVDWQFHAYGGAVHAFTNPASGNDNSKGAAYNADADRRSFATMVTFLTEIFN
jgi:dienelactone hydrolase